MDIVSRSQSSKLARAAAAAAVGSKTCMHLLRQLLLQQRKPQRSLQRLGFQRLQDVSGYGSIACTSAGVYGNDDDTQRGHLVAANGGLQLAFVLRRQAMGHPMWPELYRGAITRPSAAVTADAVDGLLAPIAAPGMEPLLLQQLTLFIMLVLGVSDSVSMSAGLGIGMNSFQPATRRSADKAQLAKCLQLLWLEIGQEMQLAAGVDLDDADVSTAAVGTYVQMVQ